MPAKLGREPPGWRPIVTVVGLSEVLVVAINRRGHERRERSRRQGDGLLKDVDDVRARQIEKEETWPAEAGPRVCLLSVLCLVGVVAARLSLACVSWVSYVSVCQPSPLRGVSVVRKATRSTLADDSLLCLW